MSSQMSLDKKKVVLGLSGGVDSTTAALLLKKQGLTVVGLYFDALGNNQNGKNEAKKVADELGIEFIYKNVSHVFSNEVISNFCAEYKNGRTPNPCIVCNPTVKFPTLIEEANKQGAYYIATGHYANTFYDEAMESWYLKRGENEKKDQSYMLYRLEESIIKRLIFPIGSIDDKEKVRDIARRDKLNNSEKKDSQEICFIKDDYIDYLNEAGIKSEPGNFVDKKGKVLGKHKGIINYTIGQRKKLGITLAKPAFVTKIDEEKNEVTLGDNQDLFTKTIISRDNFFVDTGNNICPEYLENSRIFAKIRYASKVSEGLLKTNGDTVEVEFLEPQRAPTPGQSVVFYLNDKVLGGGFIDNSGFLD